MDKNSESNQDGKARPKNIFVITSMYYAAITELTDKAIGEKVGRYADKRQLEVHNSISCQKGSASMLTPSASMLT